MTFIQKISKARFGLLAVPPAILMLNLLTEQLDLSDNVFQTISQVLQTTWGIVFVTVIGPVIEELVFRLGILGAMMRWTRLSPLVSIVISAVVFSIAHWNPAQTPFALAMGIMLGAFYWRSGLWLCILVHIFNNCLAVMEFKMLGDNAETFSLSHYIGGPAVAWSLIISMAVFATWSMYRYMHETYIYTAVGGQAAEIIRTK